MLFFFLFAFLLTNTQNCGAETKNPSLLDTSDTNNSYSIVPSHSYQYYTNVREDYMDSTYQPKSTERAPEESSGYIYSKPAKYSTYEVPNSKVPSPSYQQPALTGDSDTNKQPQTNFYYNYYTIAPQTSDMAATAHTSMSPTDAKNPPEHIKYKVPEPHGYYESYDLTPTDHPKPTYNDHEHYHLDQRQQEGRDADSFLPPPGPSGPFGGPGPSGPPGPPPPPPPPMKGSIDYILIPLILIGIAGPIFVVLYVILGAFEAKLAPIVRRSFPDSSLNLKNIDLDPLISFVSRALEKYGY